MKMNVSLGICIMLLMTSFVAITTVADDYQPFAGPNYMGITSSSQHRIIGSGTFTTAFYVDVNSEIDSVEIDNLTFLPAGIVDYTSFTWGNLFTQVLADNPDWMGIPLPSTTVSPVRIHNSEGYVSWDVWTWVITNNIPPPAATLNNTNGTMITITWTPRSCGKVSMVMTGLFSITALNGSEVGTTLRSLDIWIHPMAITGFTAIKQGSTQINLAWTKHTGDDKTLIRWRSDTYPTSVTDGTLLYNSTGSSTSQTGLSSGDTRYYSAWGWNETGDIYSYTYVTASAQTNRVPVISATPTPTNNSINQPRSLSWSDSITDPDADSISWTIQCSNGQTNSGSGAGGTKSLSLSGLAYSTTYKVWVNASDATDTTRKWFDFTTLGNIAPAQGTPSPTNGSTGRAFAFAWSIPLSDANGDLMNYRISCSNGQFSDVAGAANGTKSLSLTGLAKLTWYKVWVNVTDGTIYTRRWYNFQTMDNTPPIFGTPSPTNGSTGQNLALTWSITMTDAELDTISWTIQCSGQSNSGAGSSGLTASLSLTGLSYSTIYKVYVNATDAGGSGTYTRRWYQFTTKGNQPPSIPTTIVPADDATNVNPGIGHLRVVVSDPDGHSMTVRFYWGNDTLIGTDAGVVSGQFADMTIPDLLEMTEYEWYVNISDGYGGYRRGPAADTWVFTTSEFASGYPGQGQGSANDVLFLIMLQNIPVQGAMITINQGTSVQTMGAIVYTAATGQDGIYQFTLPDGTYIVTVTSPGAETYQQSFKVAGDTSSVIYLKQTGGGFPWPYFIVAALIVCLLAYLVVSGKIGGRKRKY